jgi:hypothetical protein
MDQEPSPERLVGDQGRVRGPGMAWLVLAAGTALCLAALLS